jgi:hypothetical protein
MKTTTRTILAVLLILLLAAVSAGATITIREWSLPQKSFPHDPAVGPDGSL